MMTRSVVVVKSLILRTIESCFNRCAVVCYISLSGGEV